MLKLNGKTIFDITQNSITELQYIFKINFFEEGVNIMTNMPIITSAAIITTDKCAAAC